MRQLITEAEIDAYAWHHDHGLTVREAALLVGRSKSALHARYLERQQQALASKLEEEITRPINEVLAEIFEPESSASSADVTVSRVADIPSLQDRIRRFVASVFKTIGKVTRIAV